MKVGKQRLPLFCNPVYYHLLKSIHMNPGVCLSRISGIFKKKRPTLIRQFNVLQKDTGLVYKQKKIIEKGRYIFSMNKGKRKHYYLTKKGLKLLALQEEFFLIKKMYEDKLQEIEKKYWGLNKK